MIFLPVYTKSITVPANTAVTSKKEDELFIIKGVITQVEIGYPSGCNGLVHIQLFDGSHQFIPSEHGQDLSGNDEVVPIKGEEYRLTHSKSSIMVKTWNLDTVNPHTLSVRVWVVSEREHNTGFLFEQELPYVRRRSPSRVEFRRGTL